VVYSYSKDVELEGKTDEGSERNSDSGVRFIRSGESFCRKPERNRGGDRSMLAKEAGLGKNGPMQPLTRDREKNDTALRIASPTKFTVSKGGEGTPDKEREWEVAPRAGF